MKFIKDIIGEKREQGPLDPSLAAVESPPQAPAGDMLTAILAESRSQQQPELRAPDQAAPAPLKSAPLKLETAARVVAPEKPVRPAAVPPTSDALEAFLAQQSQALTAVSAAEPATGALQVNAAEDPQAGVEPDGLERPYRIFTRRNRTKMLQLEAAAEAANQAQDTAVLPETDAGQSAHTRLLDLDEDEFLHVGQATEDTAAPAEPEATEEIAGAVADMLQDQDPIQDAPSQGHTPFAQDRDLDGEPDLGEAAGQAMVPDLEELVTDPAPAGPGSGPGTQTPVHLRSTGPVAETPEVPEPQAASGRELSAAFPEPAFAETAAAAGLDLGEADLGLSVGRAGRVKTRLLGFDSDIEAGDPFGQTGSQGDSGVTQFPVGWLVVVDGPGRGAGFTLFAGVSTLGRGEGQTIRLDFGDSSISRDQHAAIAFDPEQQGFFIGHGGKANLVRLNGRPVLSTEDLATNSVIRIGETTLRFVALCGEEFSWVGQDMEVPGHAQFG